jgi:predicted  nucleic acid-binding Zn-ribbon protein
MHTAFVELCRLRVRIERLRLQIARGHMGRLIEIKGLAGAVQEAKDAIKAARGATADLSTTARALALEAADVKEQLQEARDDLKFEASTLGNSSGSEQKSEPRKGAALTEEEIASLAPITPQQVLPRPGDA